MNVSPYAGRLGFLESVMVPKADERLDKEEGDDNGTKYCMAVVMELE